MEIGGGIHMYYLDNAATTRPYAEVVEKVDECLKFAFGNPSSIHPVGIGANRMVTDARAALAALFHVPPTGIVFCGSGTEADNLAIQGTLRRHGGEFAGEMVTTGSEHAAIVQTAIWLEECGVKVSYVSLDAKSGQIDLEHLGELVTPRTRLVSVQHVNSETGAIQDLAAISRVVKSINRKTLLHSDGVQAFTKIPVCLQEIGVDMYSISGHKFGGIKGAGALIMGRPVRLQTLLHGGGQESGVRSGTENVAGIAALSLAAEISCRKQEENYRKVQDFSDWFKSRLKEEISGIRIYEAPKRIPHIVSISIPSIPGEVLLHHLARDEIFVGTGSACHASSKKLSAALQSLKFSPQRIRETTRVSFSAEELPENREVFLGKFLESVNELLKMA